MCGVMRPDGATCKPATAGKAVIAIMTEEEAALENRAAEPIRSPAPAAPTQTAKKETDVNAGPETKPEAECWVPKRWVVTPGRRSPNIGGIVDRHIDHLRIGWLNLNCSVVALVFGRYRLLSSWNSVCPPPWLGRASAALRS